jgi:cation diffusion facilitator family transporter
MNYLELNKPTSSSKTIAHHSQEVNRVLWRVLLVNLGVAAAKIIVGLWTDSVSMLADGFHSATDASSNVIGLVGSTIARQPPDRNHPYGHQKYETFATLAIGLLLLITSWNILENAVTRLVAGSAPEIGPLSFGVMGLTLVLNVLVVLYEKNKGRRLNSSLLLADAAHTRSDIFVSLSVLASLVAIKAGWSWLDPVMALIIVAVIGYTGWRIIWNASNVLADSAVVDTAAVERVALSVAGVQSCHKIRSRGSEQATHLDLHIQVDGQMPLEQAHLLGHITQDRLQSELGLSEVMVHVEPAQERAITVPYLRAEVNRRG